MPPPLDISLLLLLRHSQIFIHVLGLPKHTAKYRPSILKDAYHAGDPPLLVVGGDNRGVLEDGSNLAVTTVDDDDVGDMMCTKKLGFFVRKGLRERLSRLLRSSHQLLCNYKVWVSNHQEVLLVRKVSGEV